MRQFRRFIKEKVIDVLGVEPDYKEHSSLKRGKIYQSILKISDDGQGDRIAYALVILVDSSRVT